MVSPAHQATRDSREIPDSPDLPDKLGLRDNKDHKARREFRVILDRRVPVEIPVRQEILA